MAETPQPTGFNYDMLICSGGELYASWLNIFNIVSESIRQTNGPFNIDLTNSVLSGEGAKLYIAEGVKDLGGILNNETYRTFDIGYQGATTSGSYNWIGMKLEYASNLLFVNISGADALPLIISDMSGFNISGFTCIRGYKDYA